MFDYHGTKKIFVTLLAALFLVSLGATGCTTAKSSKSETIVKAKKKKKKYRRNKRRNRHYSKTKRARVKGFGYRKGDAKLLRKGQDARFASALDAW